MATEGLGLYKQKQHKPWFDEECLKFLDQRKEAKMQWLQDQNRSNVGNLNNVRCAASRCFSGGGIKSEIDELETNSKIKNIRDLYCEQQ